MTQEKLDFDLNSLVDFLTTRGTKASAATIERLAKASAAITNAPITGVKTQKITDDDRRDMLYVRQAGILAVAVEELKTWLVQNASTTDRAARDRAIRDMRHLIDPKTGEPFKPPDYRLHVLFEALTSAAVLGRRCIDDELADELLNREQKCLGAAHAREGVSEKVQPRNDLIIKLAKEIRLMLTVPLDKWQVAVKVLEDKRLTELKEWKAKPMRGKDNGRGGVYAIVKKNWSQLSPSLPSPKRTSRR